MWSSTSGATPMRRTIIAFQYPLAGGQGYPLATLLKIIEAVPQVTAIKDWCASPQLHERQIRTLQSLKPPVNVLTTHSSWLMSSLVMGCNGLLSGSGSVIADLQAKLFRAIRSNDLATARRINDRIWPTAEVFYSEPWVDMHNRMKEALVMMGGLPRAAVRPPLVKIPQAEIQRIRKALIAPALLDHAGRAAARRLNEDRTRPDVRQLSRRGTCLGREGRGFSTGGTAPAGASASPRSGATIPERQDRELGAQARCRRDGAARKGRRGAAGTTASTYDFKGKLETVSLVDAGQPRTRLNDGKCDRSGRFFAGGMDDKEELKICALWRLDPDLSVTLVDDGIICSNGPCWSPDDKTFYFADTFQGEIWAYDYDLATGTPSNKRVFASFKNDAGVADGSTVDAEGCVWNAQLISGDLVRYAPDGSVERRIGMAVRNITSVVFGGEKLDEIYVTSMARVTHPAVHGRFAKEAKPQFLAGSLFRITGLGIRGVAEPRFAG
jgi:sugar lactone lactonase YvrE